MERILVRIRRSLSGTGIPSVRTAWQPEVVIAVALGILTLLGIGLMNLALHSQPQYVLLAEAFLQGKLHFLTQLPSGGYDAALMNGRYYWPLPPFPAVLLMPFVLLGYVVRAPFEQGYLQFLLVVAVVVLVYKIARRFDFAAVDAGVLAFAFVVGSMFLGVAFLPFYSYFAHVVATVALLAALLEYLGKRRWWLVGLCIGAALASRTTAGIAALFFIGDILLDRSHGWVERWRRAVEFLGPFLIVAALLALYNYLRFGNVLEAGYALQVMQNNALITARSYGLFSFRHLPGNLFYAFFSPPAPVFAGGSGPVLAFPFLAVNPWGMGIFFTSPYLLRMFSLRYRERWQKIAWITVALTALAVFLYYGVGWIQFGYRYALDFLPLVFVLFLSAYRSQIGALSRPLRWLIVLSGAFNLYLVAQFALWGAAQLH